jgi:hypothetical protein
MSRGAVPYVGISKTLKHPPHDPNQLAKLVEDAEAKRTKCDPYKKRPA